MLEPVVLSKLALMEQAIAQYCKPAEPGGGKETSSKVKTVDVGQITVEVLTKLSVVNNLLKSSTDPKKLAKLEPIISKIAGDACEKLQHITTSAGLAGSSFSLAINAIRIAIGAKNIVELKRAITVLESQVKGLTDDLIKTAQGAYPGAEAEAVLGKSCLGLINAPKKNIRAAALRAYNDSREGSRVLKQIYKDRDEYTASPASPEERHHPLTPYEQAVLIGRLNPTSGSRIVMSPSKLLREQRKYLAKASRYLERQGLSVRSFINPSSASGLDRELRTQIHEELSNTIGFAPDDASLEQKAQSDYQRNLAQKAMRAASTERVLRHTKRAKDAQMIKTGLAGVGIATGAVGLAAGVLLATQGAALPALVGMGLIGADLIKMAAEEVVDAHAPAENPALDRIVNSKINDICMDINGGGYYMQSMEALIEQCTVLIDEIRNAAIFTANFTSSRTEDKSKLRQRQLAEAAEELKFIIVRLGAAMHENPLVSIEIAEELKKIRAKINSYLSLPSISVEELRKRLPPTDWSPYFRMTQDVNKEITGLGLELGLDEESKKILSQALQQHVALEPACSETFVKEQALSDKEHEEKESVTEEEEPNEDHWVLTEELKPIYASTAREQRLKFFTPFGYASEGASLFKYKDALTAVPFSTKRWIQESLRSIFSSPRRVEGVTSGPSLFGPYSRLSYPYYYPDPWRVEGGTSGSSLPTPSVKTVHPPTTAGAGMSIFSAEGKALGRGHCQPVLGGFPAVSGLKRRLPWS